MQKFMKTVTTALVCTMMFQTTAMAAPLDELNEILEKQQSASQESLLSDTLGWKELGEAIKTNGIDFSLTGGLTEGTVTAIDMEGEIPEDGYINLGFQLDRNAKQYLLSAGFGAEGADLGNLSLYGDAGKLALSIPQIFVGAVSLEAGNLLEQYTGSALETFLVQNGAGFEVPSIDMKFYPEESDLEGLIGSTASLEEVLTEQMKAYEEDVQVEKSEEGEYTVYTMIMERDMIMGIYETIFDLYGSAFSAAGAVGSTDLAEFEAEMNEMLAMMETILPEQFEMDFLVKDELVEKITYEIYLDTSAMEAAEEAFDEGAAGDVDLEEETDEDEFKGYLSYEIVYNEPAQPISSMDMNAVIMDEERAELGTIVMQLRSGVENNVSEMTMDMAITAEGESVYSGTIYKHTFDASTGDLDMRISIEDGTTALMELKLDSTFTEVEAGKSFVWKVDGLTMEVEGESIGVTGEIKVSADPGEVTAPSQERVILKLSEDELMGLLMEVMQNAQVWAAQFEPDSYEIDDDAYELEDDFYEMEEDYEGSDEGAASVSIIGGADGPTSVFVAGKVS